MAATTQAQAEVIKEAQRAGIAHAREHDDGTKDTPNDNCYDYGGCRGLTV
jgi:hypothetical protein